MILTMNTDSNNDFSSNTQDVTPKMVEDFLPKNTLAENHIQPTHILLDRNDGKAKDYLVSFQSGLHEFRPCELILFLEPT